MHTDSGSWLTELVGRLHSLPHDSAQTLPDRDCTPVELYEALSPTMALLPSSIRAAQAVQPIPAPVVPCAPFGDGDPTRLGRRFPTADNRHDDMDRATWEIAARIQAYTPGLDVAVNPHQPRSLFRAWKAFITALDVRNVLPVYADWWIDVASMELFEVLLQETGDGESWDKLAYAHLDALAYGPVFFAPIGYQWWERINEADNPVIDQLLLVIISLELGGGHYDNRLPSYALTTAEVLPLADLVQRLDSTAPSLADLLRFMLLDTGHPILDICPEEMDGEQVTWADFPSMVEQWQEAQPYLARCEAARARFAGMDKVTIGRTFLGLLQGVPNGSVA